MKKQVYSFVLILGLMPSLILAKSPDPLVAALEAQVRDRLDLNLQEWQYHKYPDFNFTVDTEGELVGLESVKASRDYNTRVCKSTIKDMQPFASEFRDHEFTIECKPEFELSKKEQKTALKYQEQYAAEIGKQIFLRAKGSSFEELEAKLLALELKLAPSGKLLSVTTTSSSGFAEIDSAFIEATQTIDAFPKPDLNQYRLKAGKNPKSATLDLYFLLGKDHKGIRPEDAIATGAALGSIGISTVSIIQNIMLLAR
ncbi:MAG: TonB C-terminal domain-containing protein [Cyanobacteria bacterium]|nr:TonB C-terminal domain-containing protein [Cyanobacteriota bacterium]MDA1020704.1 TonB C-terminal domain-containing protein [Cyanobacteriota bacterium]